MMKVWVVSKVQEFKAMGMNHEVSKPVTVHFAGGWADVWIKAQPKEEGVSYKVDIAELNPTDEETEASNRGDNDDQ